MKLSVSFVTAPGRTAPWLALGLIVVSVFMAISAFVFALSGWVQRAEQPELETRLERAKKAADEVSETPLPPRADLDRLRTRVVAINQITGVGGKTLTDVLQRLEASLPDDVALTTLHYQRRQKEITLVAEATRADILTEVLQRLESNGAFHDVRLLRQSERSSGRGGVQFELRLKD